MDERVPCPATGTIDVVLLSGEEKEEREAECARGVINDREALETETEEALTAHCSPTADDKSRAEADGFKAVLDARVSEPPRRAIASEGNVTAESMRDERTGLIVAHRLCMSARITVLTRELAERALPPRDACKEKRVVLCAARVLKSIAES